MTSSANKAILALQIRIKGLVQGVGFRPFVYRTAHSYGIKGWVANHTNGITITAQGPEKQLAQFVEDIKDKAPEVSEIDEIQIKSINKENYPDFTILASEDLTDETSEISPDIAVCNDCLADLQQQPHRINYPFINCTHCGPRFSIIKDFPYDRAKTTMDVFEMCETCRNEYNSILDRRFHAQPVACNDCGPTYTLHAQTAIVYDFREILKESASLIHQGKIIALKGTGGFHIMCNALDEKAVKKLRNIKQREGKPFAVMFKDLDTVKNFADISLFEETALQSWRRPVVIVKSTRTLAEGITLGLDTLGVFLPYMPVHYLLFEQLQTPAIVLTSGNVADEPIIIDNNDAYEAFGDLTDAIIDYNRKIYNRNDDSVVRVMTGTERIVRRSRGYVPAPVRMNLDVNGIFAAGAELSNCFCLGKENKAYLSQHIGDLKNMETLEFYEETIQRFQKIFRIKPDTTVVDMHPDYLSTRYARSLNIPVTEVQHHHAHIAACMAENGISEPVIGIAFDGTGYGTDGHIWGGEFLTCDYNNFIRQGHLEYMPVPGGDAVSKEPWRMAVSLLYQIFGTDLPEDLPLLKCIDSSKIRQITEAIRKQINCPLSSGMGRLFDGLAALTGLCYHSRFHAEAPMRLESARNHECNEFYDFDVIDHTLSFRPCILQVVKDLANNIPSSVISAKFHNTVVEASVRMVIKIARETEINKVVLSGGSFQNKFLFESLHDQLSRNHLTVITHTVVPCNDGGIALGQLAVAARRRMC